jgi:transposase
VAGLLALDLHKDYIYGYAERPGEKIRRFRFPNGREHWQELARQWVDKETSVVFEATGCAFALYDTLFPLAREVVVANPVELKRYGSGRHTDEVDAERLAKMMALGTVPTVWVPPQKVREVRQLLQHRDALVQDTVAWRNRALMALQAQGVVLPRGSDPVKELGEAFTGLPVATQTIVASSLTMAHFLEEEAEAITAQILELLQDEESFRVLLSLPGVGPLTAAVIWATIGDPDRFPTKKQVTRYAGFDATVFQSGEKHHHGHISRHGSSLLRKYAVEAALAAIRSVVNNAFSEYYHHLKPYCGHQRAVVATARKLLIVAWTLMKAVRPAREVDQRKFQTKTKMVERRAATYPSEERWAVLASPSQRTEANAA